jgi:hypothetical protein
MQKATDDSAEQSVKDEIQGRLDTANGDKITLEGEKTAIDDQLLPIQTAWDGAEATRIEDEAEELE